MRKVTRTGQQWLGSGFSVNLANDMLLLKRTTSALEPKPQCYGGGHGKLAGVVGWIERRIKEKSDLTLDELVVELRDKQRVDAHRVSVRRVLRNLNVAHKKDLRAVEQKRPEVALAREVWIGHRQPFTRDMLTRIGLVD